MAIFSFFEKILIDIRNFFWEYPDLLFFSKNSLTKRVSIAYLKSRPFSHALLLIVGFLAISLAMITNVDAFLRINTDTFIEGVVVGENDNGELQKVISINPLIVTNIQIKRDIIELVYEPLLRIDQNGDVQLVLAESYADLGDSKVFRFKLRENVRWHDGSEFTADDVVATFKLLSNLEYGQQTSSVYSKAATKIDIKKIDKYRVEFSLKDKNTVMPNFFEVIAFKILPASKIDELNVNNIIYAEPQINRKPIGTGPFKVLSLNGDKITMYANENYYNGKPNLKKVIFRLYKDQNQAINDLKTGQIHAMVGLTSDSIQDIQTYPNLAIHSSNVIYNQYWALYFNLSDSGNETLKDLKVRQAINYAINKQLVSEALVDLATPAKGPIPETSFAFYDYDVYSQSLEKANDLLEEAGWILEDGQNYRKKDGKILEFNFVYVKNFDRDKIVKVIQDDLKSVGIKLNLISGTISEVNNNYVLPSYFDILLYGVSTFIDPDRYELFHSSQIGYPNLNISSYKSEEQTTRIKDGKKERIPEVDYRLERGRSFLDEEARKKEYKEFQRIVLSESPVIFLYHPVFTYITNKRVTGINMDKMTALEDRFHGIINWKIEISDVVF